MTSMSELELNGNQIVLDEELVVPNAAMIAREVLAPIRREGIDR